MMLLLTFPLGLSLSMPAFPRSTAKRSHTCKERACYGDISDSHCAADHNMPANPRECTLACIKHGDRYVFVFRGKVLMIAKQNMPELEKYAGEHVRIMGTRTSGGKGITIASIRTTQRRKKKAKTEGL